MQENDTPCLVKTEQGFSVLYKEKYLYSKYNPSKNIIQKISSLEILPGSIILCFSPVLEHGLLELAEKVSEKNCTIILCEKDKTLFEFSQNNIPKSTLEKIAFLTPDELFDLPKILQKKHHKFMCGYELKPCGTYRRVIRIDMSAGVNFYADFYNELEDACVSSVKQFWTNRITLAKFGRKFSINLFRNLKVLPYSTPLKSFIGKIEKPIIVFGSGESTMEGVKKIAQNRNDFFILCVDTAFPLLKKMRIVPNGIVLEECQNIISKSFFGIPKNTIIFQSLSSLPHPAGKKFPNNQISFFATEYDSTYFFENLKSKSFFPPVIPPFGSVGITAFFLANLFKKSDEVSVFTFGLDFAYSKGKTHANGTASHTERLINLYRLNQCENFSACFGTASVKIENEKFPYSTQILLSYKNTFDALKKSVKKITSEIFFENECCSEKSKNQIAEYLKDESTTLLELKNILSGKTQMNDEDRNKKISDILFTREYLFLHFPDGYNPSLELSFLKRVRSQIDFFEKYLGEIYDTNRTAESRRTVRRGLERTRR